MALGRTITYFSEVQGRLVDAEGTPQAGVHIRRSWRRSPEHSPIVDETVTDENGFFTFPAATRRNILARVLPGTPVIRQEMIAFGPEGLVVLWKAVKSNLDHNGELHGSPLDLICRIDEEPHGDGPAWGTCSEAEGFPAIPVGSIPTDEEIRPTWEWPAGRSVQVALLVQIRRIEPARKGFLGIRHSPSLAGSLPDPHEILGTIVHGPAPFLGRDIFLRLPGTEAEDLTVGGIAALGLIENGGICVCIAAAPEGSLEEQQTWIENWACH